MDRKEFLTTGLLGMAGIYGSFPTFHSRQIDSEPLDPALVKEFVIAGHDDFDHTKRLLSKEPNLIYARHDWGGGDFEEAIEGAGHVGNHEIANFLIEKGARVNLFVLTMLGKSSLVIPVLEEYPNLIYAKGPHGFTLLHHANVGGEASVEILDYLNDQGLNKSKVEM